MMNRLKFSAQNYINAFNAHYKKKCINDAYYPFLSFSVLAASLQFDYKPYYLCLYTLYRI